MIKIDEENIGTLSKCTPDEPVFVLRAKDVLAPAVVRIWAQIARLYNVPLRKRVEAMDLATEMESWQASNGSKTPD